MTSSTGLINRQARYPETSTHLEDIKIVNLRPAVLQKEKYSTSRLK